MQDSGETKDEISEMLNLIENCFPSEVLATLLAHAWVENQRLFDDNKRLSETVKEMETLINSYSLKFGHPDRDKLLEAMSRDNKYAKQMLGGVQYHKVQRARSMADTKHNRPGGSRDKRKKIQEIWLSGKYSSKDLCAEQECAALEMSYSTARKALRNLPKPPNIKQS